MHGKNVGQRNLVRPTRSASESPLIRLEKGVQGLKKIGPDQARFLLDGEPIDVRIDADRCLMLCAPMKNGHLDVLHLLHRNHLIQGPCKFAQNGGGKILIAEAPLSRKPGHLSEWFEASKEGLRLGMSVLSSEEDSLRRFEEAPSPAADADIEERVAGALAELGISASLQGHGVWGWSVDTRRLLHKIRVSISQRKEAQYVHVESAGDSLGPLLSTESREALARFLLAANYYVRFARCSLLADGGDQGLRFLAESVAPLPLFDCDLAHVMIEAVVMLGQCCREETEALCHPSIARIYLATRIAGKRQEEVKNDGR